LTGRRAEVIVRQVRYRRLNITGRRVTALFALLSLAIVVTGATVALAADSAAGGEPCVGCGGCEAGECGDEGENPITSHHHCCTTCCLSHAPFALPFVIASPAPLAAERTPTPVAACELPVSAEPPYRPPRI